MTIRTFEVLENFFFDFDTLLPIPNSFIFSNFYYYTNLFFFFKKNEKSKYKFIKSI
jgi:hypothetical protein